jgi:transposase
MLLQIIHEGGAYMRRAILVNHLSQDEIRKRMVTSKEREQYQRWQSIFLTSKGLQSNIVAEYVGTTKGTVHQWVYQYNHDGPDGFTLQGRGGRRFGFLSLEEEADLLDSIRPVAEKGRIINASAIKTQLEERLAKKVSKDYLYDLLHRHEWRKVMPRPQHPKADKEKQEEFKKNFRSWWQPPKKTSTRRIKDQ